MKWYIWRPVIAKIATFLEIDTYWTILDLADAHEMLDLKEEMMIGEMGKIKPKG